MEIIDKYGYLEDVLNYIEKNIVMGCGLKRIAKKANLRLEDLLKFSNYIKDFSERELLTLLKEKLEDRHSSIAGADAEVTSVDMSIENKKKNIYILLNLKWDIAVDGEKEEEVLMNVEIFKDKINIKT